MSLFGGKQKVSEVEVDGNRFSIVRPPEIIDVTAQSQNLPAVRESRPDPAPEVRMGVIPKHSWGA